MSNITLFNNGNFAFSSGAWAEGTNANTIKSTATITYAINGQFYSKSSTDNIAISYTAPAAIYSAAAGGVATGNGAFTGGANGSTRLYGIYLDTSGAVTIEPGKIVDTAALAAGAVSLEFTPSVKNKCCVAAMRIALTSGTTFTPGSTDLSASGVTATFYNLSTIPAEPLTA